jgi:TetR/AcrR family transcriptional repressor of nem operon
MRYRPEHKAEVHQKIVKDASRRVLAEGLTGAAVAAVMRDTGLTHGGFYKHFENKDELLLESLREAFRAIADKLAHAAEKSRSKAPWKAIVKSYLSLEYCDHVERGCPLTALAPELARIDETMRSHVFAELVNYRNRMLPYMPGRRAADRDLFNHGGCS